MELSGHSSVEMPQFRIRRMKLEDVPSVLEIWAQNDLHEGTNTIQSFMAVDPDGFVVAVEVDDCVEEDEQQLSGSLNKSSQPGISENKPNDDNDKSITAIEKGQYKEGKCLSCPGSAAPTCASKSSQTMKLVEKQIIGMCVGIFVHPTIAFIGLYGVRSDLHGRGIGSCMWNRMMEHIGSLNAGLYAVPEHLTMYRDRAGFASPDDRLLFIYESCKQTKLNINLLVSSIRGIQVEPITTEWHKRVIEFDSNVHGYYRSKLLPHVFNEEKSAAFVAIDIEDQEVQGYGCIRTNNIGKAMIGPLYAANDAVAELLMRNLFESLEDAVSQGVLYMTLDSNPGGERIADKLGLPKHEELQRFFRVHPYKDAKWSQVYCIHTPNLSLL